MTGMVPEKIPKMRALAAWLRAKAADTAVGLYRRKLEDLASELEEEADEAESRLKFTAPMGWHPYPVPRSRTGRGYGH